jgi:23S rRNA pseudouridine2604 synthase
MRASSRSALPSFSTRTQGRSRSGSGLSSRAERRGDPLRLNKYISETGACSRRQADQWIEAGRVTLNGVRAHLGLKVEADDEVRVDGELIGARKKPVYIALNKPAGITCTTETHVEDNIVDFVGHPERIFPVGRLDKDSEGLILLTNDGDIVNEILRSENEHEKEYLVRVNRPITDLSLGMLASGVKIMGVTTKPCKVTRVGREDFCIILTQGLNRQIRRMCSALGYRVERLRRVRIINIDLGTLAPGEWRHLSDEEVAGLTADEIKSSATPTPRPRPSIGGPSPSASPGPAPDPTAIGKNPRPHRPSVWTSKRGKKAVPPSSTRR